MWGLEYLLLFGLPENKLEILGGETRCVFPFLDRDTAAAHFQGWTEALSRWQDVVPQVATGPGQPESRVGRFTLRQYPLPIELRVPIDVDTLHALHGAFWRRDLWEAQPPGSESGWDSVFDHGDVLMNLWRCFEQVRDRVGGHHCGRVGLVLPEVGAVEPHHYYFRQGRTPRTIQGDYVCDVPDLIAEALSPATRAGIVAGRMDVYRRAGVPHVWVLEPADRSLQVYALKGDRYVRVSTLSPDAEYRSPLFPDVPVSVAELFDLQSDRHGGGPAGEPDPVPEWLVPNEKRLALEYLLLAGHPDRRYEVWEDRAPCVLAFGSHREASARFRDFLDDACRWEAAPSTRPLTVEPELEVAEVGRFRFARRGRHVHLDVAVRLEQYRLLLEAWATREAWDWGEED